MRWLAVCGSMLPAAALAQNAPAPNTPAANSPAAQYAAAARNLAQRIDNRPAAGAMPRTSDAQVDGLIAVLSDRGSRFGTPAFPVQGVATYQSVCSVPPVIVTQYARFGLDRRLAASTDPAQRETITRQVVGANTRAYQNAVLPLVAFAIRCNALHVPALEGALAGGLTPQRGQAMAQARVAIAQQIAGALALLPEQSIQPRHRISLARSLGQNAPALARTLGLSQRAALADSARRYQAAAPAALKDDLARLTAALGDRSCAGLCRLP